MTATDSVLGFLGERGPSPTSEIAQALSEYYGYHTVRSAVLDLKKKGVLVDTGERRLTRGRPEHIVALERELERAAKRDVVYARISNLPIRPGEIQFIAAAPHTTIIQRVKRWFGAK